MLSSRFFAIAMSALAGQGKSESRWTLRLVRRFRPPPPQDPTRACVDCAAVFTPKRSHARLCSPACRQRASRRSKTVTGPPRRL